MPLICHLWFGLHGLDAPVGGLGSRAAVWQSQLASHPLSQPAPSPLGRGLYMGSLVAELTWAASSRPCWAAQLLSHPFLKRGTKPGGRLGQCHQSLGLPQLVAAPLSTYK